MMRWLVALLFVCVSSSAAGTDNYRQEISIRLWGGTTRQEMFDVRMDIIRENASRGSSFWAGTIEERNLRGGMAGGLELSYGAYPWLKVLLALDGRGVSTSGTFLGVGPNTTTIPGIGFVQQQVNYLGRYSAFAQELGATVLMREFGWCRLGLTAHAGRSALAGAVERGSEDGPLRVSWWSRNLSASAPTALVGVEWEWFAPPKPLPLKGFISVGYRWLEFNRIEASYHDSTGVDVSGPYRNLDGRRRVIDFSGPEIRFGLQIVTSLATKGSERIEY